MAGYFKLNRPVLISAIVVLLYIFLVLNTVLALAAVNIKLVLNGVPSDPGVAAYVDDNGRTMVPVRYIMENMNAMVDWRADERSITVSRENTVLKMWIGSTKAYVNGQKITLDTVPVLKNNTTMVPVRFISQAFGGKVDWDGVSRTVSISLEPAVETLQVRITGNYVNFRTGPGLSYGIIDVLPEGTLLKHINTGNNWYQVERDGIKGWVSSNYSELVRNQGNSGPPDDEQPGEEAEQVRITGSYVNFRTGPGLSYSIIDVLPRGTLLKLLGKNGDWYQVQCNVSTVGWVSKNYAEPVHIPGDRELPDNDQPAARPVGLAIIGSKPVAVLRGPSPVEGLLGTASPGSKLPIWQKQGNWWLVEMGDGRRGWLADSLATFAPYQVPEDRLSIKGIEVDCLDNVIKVTVEADRAFTYKKTRWDGRIIVDINNAVLDIPPEESIIEVKRAPLTRLRLGQFTEDVVRIVFDLSAGAVLISRNTGNNRGLIFELSEPSIKGSIIVIDPGHGTDPQGPDPGAIGPSGVKEKDVNLSISLKLAELLRAAGATVYLTREGEETSYTLAERAYYANSVGADLFICIHANASLSPQTNGTATFFYALSGTAAEEQRSERQKLANCIQKALVAATQRKDLGIQESNFSVLRNTLMPSVLVETAFISNPTEEKLLASQAFQAKVAEGIFNGIKNYFSNY